MGGGGGGVDTLNRDHLIKVHVQLIPREGTRQENWCILMLEKR